jgi:glutamate synthase (NADPH/NADH) small chain
MKTRQPMRERPPQERAKDFTEVNRGYTDEQAVAEAARCLQCRVPQCVSGCPVEITIPAFIKAIAAGNPGEAARILRQKNNLPAVCGRVCPQEHQCERQCVLAKKGAPIAIGHLERYAADYAAQHASNPPPAAAPARQPVAVIGSGPAGLTCAADLAKQGFPVTVFESLHEPGGVLRYGIPEFRLPGAVLDREISGLNDLGVRFVLNTLIGRTKSIADLFTEGFAAVFIGTGAGLPVFLSIPGENLNHIYSANEFLVRVNLMHAYRFPDHDTPIYVGKNVVVIGGGNTAMDAARTALRLGAENVTLLYRRSEEEMPARVEERRHAQEEGVHFRLLTAPTRFFGDEKGFVQAVECTRMALGAADASGRRQAVPAPDAPFSLTADMVIIAIGLNPNPVLPALTAGLERDANGHLIIDKNFMTTLPGVFAGGDIVGGDTVIQAMGMGKQAAAKIAAYLATHR